MTEEEGDQVEALLLAARAGQDVRAGLAALPPPLRAEVEEVLAAEARVLRAIAAPAPARPGAGRADPWLGRLLSGCRLERLLGRGGMGAAYLARTGEGREVVVKLLGVDRAASPQLHARLVREAAALRRLRPHPNLVTVLATDVEGDPPHLVLELAHGAQLRQLVHTRGRLTPLAASRVARDVARALAALHGHGLLHRDVKPENVVVSPEGLARLIDLGIAKDPFATALTAPGQLVGTAEYMAPEQWTGGALDARTDVFGLGATLYFALCGRAPFSGGLDEVMEAATTGDLVAPRELAPDCPADLERLVLHMLDPEPRFRYARLEPLADDLERVARGLPPLGLPALVDAAGARHVLAAGARRFLVGADPAAEVRLADAGVAREHAEVRREEAGFAIVDLGAPGGTLVNDEPVGLGRELSDGDVVRVGAARLTVVDPGGRRRPPTLLEDLAREERPAPLAQALADAGDPRAIATLLERLAPDPLLDRDAAAALEAVAPGDAARLLARRGELLLRDRAAAAALLERATGERLGADPVAWLGWWLQARGRFPAQLGPAAPARALSLAPARAGAPILVVAGPGEPGLLLVGRDARCHLRLEDSTVSRLHATLLRLHRRLALRDEGGQGATLVDGHPAPVAFVDPGAELRLGDVTVAVTGALLEARGPSGQRLVDAATFAALEEAAHPSTLAAHVDLLAAAARGPAEAWAARARASRAALAAAVGRDLGAGAEPWRAALGPARGPQVAPAGWL